MAKDPAFLFYPGDFSTGTQFFTDEQVGKYVRLLMAQHQHGHLSENQVLHICKTYDKDVMNKFIKDSTGLWFNQRLDNEIFKRKEYSKSRSKNRSSKNNTSKTYVEHMENKNKNKDIDIINNKEYVSIAGAIVNHESALDFYEAQLNGTQKEYSLPAWRPLIPKWFAEHLMEDFTDATHLKNSFKKWYINQNQVGNGKPKTKLLDLTNL